MNADREATIDLILRKTIKGCGVLLCLCGALVLLFYLLSQPWLPYTEPGLQQALEEHFPHARLEGIRERTENCVIVVTDSDSLGPMHVMLQRENGWWHYVDHAFEAGGRPAMIACPT